MDIFGRYVTPVFWILLNVIMFISDSRAGATGWCFIWGLLTGLWGAVILYNLVEDLS